MDRSLIDAHGKALALLAALLDRAGVVPAAEFGEMMAAIAELDDDPSQSAILASWADTIREADALKE